MARLREQLTRRRLALALLAVGGAATLWYGAPIAAREMAFFRVRRVDVVGAEWLAPEAVVAAMRLRPGASVADPLPPLERRVLAVPGVLQVAVTRRLPGALVVTIRERQPVAYAPVDGVLTPIDARGRTLPYDARRGARSLPVLGAPDTAAAKVLGRLQRAEPGLYAAATAAWSEPPAVVVVTPKGRLRLDPATSDSALREVRLVSERLSAEGRPWGELDGRFAGMVIRREVGS